MPLGKKCQVCDKIIVEHTKEGKYVGEKYFLSFCSDKCKEDWKVLEKIKKKKRGIHNYNIKKLNPQIIEKFKSMCYLCHSTNNLQVHHIIPFSEGGTAELKNLCLTCSDCHYILGDKSSSKVKKWIFDGDNFRYRLNPEFLRKRIGRLNKLKELRDDIELVNVYCGDCKRPHIYLKLKGK